MTDTDNELRSLLGIGIQETTDGAIIRIIEELSGIKYVGGGLFHVPGGSPHRLPLALAIQLKKESIKKRADAEREVWETMSRLMPRFGEAIDDLKKEIDLEALPVSVRKALSSTTFSLDSLREVSFLWLEMLGMEESRRGDGG